MGIETAVAIASVVSSLAAAASAAYSMSQSGKGGKLPGLPSLPPSDKAASGAMRSELFGGVTPSFKGGLAGTPISPAPGAGGSTDKPIGGADEFASILDKMKEGQGSASPLGGSTVLGGGGSGLIG